MLYIHIDGDNVGSHIELCLMDGDINKAQKISKDVTNGMELIKSKLINKLNATVYICAGDDLIASFEPESEFFDFLENAKSNYFNSTGLTISIGLGDTIKGSLDNLRRAKMSGKNRIIGPQHV